MYSLGARINLVVCQKSKINDWYDHIEKYYGDKKTLYDCTIWKKKDWELFAKDPNEPCTLLINYDLIFRRPELLRLRHFTLLLDESSIIQNENSKRSKFISRLKPDNVILLSGTPTGGKYERLWSQMRLLGWDITKEMFYNQYVEYHYDDSDGFPRMVIDGYKNEDRLKKKMRKYGCRFLKTEDVFDLPEQVHQTIKINTIQEYFTFKKDSIVVVDDTELVGDMILTKMLYERQLCGQYNKNKLSAFADLLESTNDRLVVFYNFNEELNKLHEIAFGQFDRACSLINGNEKNLEAYENCEDSVTFVQYQAGAMGLNLQKANKIIYFTPPLSSELFEQSKKRIHRIGQNRTCFYYYLTCKNSVEEKIYKTLAMRRDYTEELFNGESIV